MFKHLWLCFKYRKFKYWELVQQHSLLIKAARRCAYDLRHCSQELEPSEQFYNDRDFWFKRSHDWIELFTEDGAKNYRHRLHGEIDNLEFEIKKLRKVCEDHGVPEELWSEKIF